MDDADRAQLINDQFQTDVLARAQNNHSSGTSLLFCDDCGEKIPEARRKAVPGCKLCVECQQEQEQTLSNWRTT